MLSLLSKEARTPHQASCTSSIQISDVIGDITDLLSIRSFHSLMLRFKFIINDLDVFFGGSANVHGQQVRWPVFKLYLDHAIMSPVELGVYPFIAPKRKFPKAVLAVIQWSKPVRSDAPRSYRHQTFDWPRSYVIISSLFCSLFLDQKRPILLLYPWVESKSPLVSHSGFIKVWCLAPVLSGTPKLVSKPRFGQTHLHSARQFPFIHLVRQGGGEAAVRSNLIVTRARLVIVNFNKSTQDNSNDPNQLPLRLRHLNNSSHYRTSHSSTNLTLRKSVSLEQLVLLSVQFIRHT